MLDPIRQLYAGNKGLNYGGFTGFGGQGGGATGVVSGLRSTDDYLKMMSADANAADLDMLLEAADGGLMGILTKKPTTSNPYLAGKGSEADKLADFNKAFMEQYGVTSADPLGFEKALASGDVSKIIKSGKISDAIYDSGTGELIKDAEYADFPFISYIDKSGESPVNREFSARILSDYKTLPKDEFKARYQGQFGDLGPEFAQMYDTFGDSQFSKLLEEYLPYATGQLSDMPGRSVVDRLSDMIGGSNNVVPKNEVQPNIFDTVELPENYYPEEISDDEMGDIVDYVENLNEPNVNLSEPSVNLNENNIDLNQLNPSQAELEQALSGQNENEGFNITEAIQEYAPAVIEELQEFSNNPLNYIKGLIY